MGLIKAVIIFIAIAVSTNAWALEKKLVTTNTFAIFISDSTNTGLTAKTLADVNIHYACAGSVDSTIDETGDTLTEIDATNAAGYYWIATNDNIGCSAEQELLMWSTGSGVTPKPRLVKAVANIESDTKTDTAAILVDTADIQPNYATSSALATAQADLDNPAQYKADVTNLDATISSRLAGSAAPANFGDLAITATTGLVDVNDKTGFRLSVGGVDDVWDEDMSGHTTTGSFGLKIKLLRR